MAGTTGTPSQLEKCNQFHSLHHSGKLLLLPNIWDPLGALLLENLGYPAVATASASVAFANGYDDGELIPLKDLLILLKRISDIVSIPVSADVESGYAANDDQLQENVRRLIETGIVGINIEDTDKQTNNILPTELQCHRIKLIRKASDERGIRLFINARTDIFIRGNQFTTPESKLEETLRRGAAYKSAGADGFFPIAMKETHHIKKVVGSLRMPVNISLIPGAPKLDQLAEMGVARVSLGPGFLKIAMKALKETASKLLALEGENEIKENEITTLYLKNLVNKPG